jgi:hypothetical protein
MAKFRVKYHRGDREQTFETIIEISGVSSPNQAMIKIKEEPYKYKDLSFNDVQIMKVEKVDSWEQ